MGIYRMIYTSLDIFNWAFPNILKLVYNFPVYVGGKLIWRNGKAHSNMLYRQKNMVYD